MNSLTDFVLREEYKRIESIGDNLSEINSLMNWERFRPMVKCLFRDGTENGGRPHLDEILMIKVLLIQEWYTLSDPETERQILDRISFRYFLGFPDKAPDFSTIWFFRERLVKSGKHHEIWAELQRQLDEKGLTVKKGVIQDASVITSDPGRANKNKPRGKDAKTRRSKDGTWERKGDKVQFGYKLHSKADVDYGNAQQLNDSFKAVPASKILP